MCDSKYRQDNHVGGRKQYCPSCGHKRCVFYTKKGDLTPYAFSCGYIEQRGRMSLEKEHSCYHVKGVTVSFGGATVGGGGFDQDEKRVWETFDTLSEARKFFRTFPKQTPKIQEVAA